MNNKKKIETIRRRNADLNKQLEEMKFKIDFDSSLNMKGYEHAKELISELEPIKLKWNKELIELENKKNEYCNLIDDLNKIKKTMYDIGFKVPWYKKIFNKIKHI